MLALGADPRAQTGLMRTVNDPSLLGETPTALCTNYTAVTDNLERGIDALLAAGAPITSLLTPEHGYWGAVQAGQSEGDGHDAATGLPVWDTYQLSGEALDALLATSGAAQIAFDVQDIGTRFYTYTWTLFDLLCSCARRGLPLIVLDRPNPLGVEQAGPGLLAQYSSFIGRVSIPLQHGLTLGELARWFNAVHVPQTTGRAAELRVISLMPGDEEGDEEAATSAHASWVMPSPNIPTLTSARVYPATGLLEGTMLSEGRGTTKPFELFGAPWTDARLARALNEAHLPGVVFREAVFRPVFSKWAGDVIHGAQLHLLDASAVDVITTGLTLLQTLRRLYPDEQLWRPAEPGRPAFISLLWGSPALQDGLASGASREEILTASPSPDELPKGIRLYR